MDKMVLIPLIMGLVLIFCRGPRDLFFYYFLPVLTLFPVYYDFKLMQGLPEFSFWSAALIPVLFAWIVKGKGEGYFFSWLDVIILLNLLLIFYGQWMNSGYKPAQKVLFNDLMARFFPYLLAKAYFSDGENRIQMLKVMVILGVIVGFFMMYEFKLWYNVFDKPLRKLWPHSVPWELPMKRWGFKRAFGPFGHPICGGYFLAMIVPVAIWLWRGRYFRGLWDPQRGENLWGLKTVLLIAAIPFLLTPLKERDKTALLAVLFGLILIAGVAHWIKGGSRKIPLDMLFVIACIGGCIASISRAPILGMALSFIILWYGWSRRKMLVVGVVFLCLCLSLPFVLPRVISYISADRATAQTEEQRNAAYRRELMDNYKEVIEEKPWFGFGRFDIPVVKNQESIDNEYLFLTLTSGKVALYAYLLTIVYVLLRLLRFALSKSFNSEEGRLGWCLLAGCLAAAFTQTTVYAGTQTVQFFYMMAGMSEAMVSAPTLVTVMAPASGISMTGQRSVYGFLRILPAPFAASPLGFSRTPSKVKNGYHFYRTL